MHTLNQLLQRLAESGIEFVVIGGYAGVLHGSALVTRDLYLRTDWGVVDILSNVLGVGEFHRLKANAEPLQIAPRRNSA